MSALMLADDVKGQSPDAAAQQRNVYACNNGYATCKPELLTEQQRQSADKAALERNVYACNNGYATCNPRLLTQQQRKSADRAALERNVYACNNGYATCKPELLTEQQRESAGKAALERNVYACDNGYATCKLQLLTERQRHAVSKAALERSARSGSSRRLPAVPMVFHGYPCTVDCSGHDAGYRWAEEKGIDDPDDCGGNSESFIEGCRAFAEEQRAESEDGDSDEDD